MGDRPLGFMHCIRILKLDWHGIFRIRQLDFAKDLLQVGSSFKYREVAALFSLLRRPAEEGIRLRAVSGANGVVNVGISAGFIELVVEGCYDVFPGLIESNDAVLLTIT